MDEKKRIALIEDNDGDVYLIERALAAMQRPFETCRFKDGEEALSVLLASQETSFPDLILLDLNMPRCDGLDILRRIRASPKLNDVPVGILTGSVAASDRQRASTIGSTCYIHKDSHYDAFVSNVGQAVEAMLDGKKSRKEPPETISEASASDPHAKGKGA
jgi:CheY-like chemotaxis protein